MSSVCASRQGRFQRYFAYRQEGIAQDMSTILAQRRVELVAVRDNLDAEAKRRKMVTERRQGPRMIRDFFGMNNGSLVSSR